MKRLLWTVALAVAGFAIGWKDPGVRPDPRHVVIVAVWFCCSGFGFGSIFGKRRPRKALFLFYWVLTLALVSAIFSPFVPLTPFVERLAFASAAGALLGGAVGFAQLKFSTARQSAERPVNAQ